MTEAEAKAAEIDPGQKWHYFRLDDGKNNLAPPAEFSTGFRLESIALGNLDDQWLGTGDKVGVVTPWTST